MRQRQDRVGGVREDSGRAPGCGVFVRKMCAILVGCAVNRILRWYQLATTFMAKIEPSEWAWPLIDWPMHSQSHHEQRSNTKL